jgi:2-dehydro-3-deoxyphosphooctonate aldolase (KDO 8-P synthase)
MPRPDPQGAHASPPAERVEPFELAPGVVVGGPGLAVVAGPCVLESEEMVLAVARRLAALARRLSLGLVFKSSFDKANRTSIGSYRGPGLPAGLALLARVREETGLPLLTDVHEPWQCEPAARVCDVLQIPAFLCRQTDLVVAAAAPGRALNVKKGQIAAPDDMARVAEKAWSVGNRRVVVTERGASFGYHNLVVDMRSFAWLHRLGLPVIYDATHSLQLPGGGETTGGAREFAEPLARAAVAAGADGVFLEVHPDPSQARSDASTQLDPDRLEALVESLLAVRRVVPPAAAGAETPP